jgi:hypothetical protein
MARMATELERVVSGSQARFNELKARYPRLDAWLVFALREHQVELPSDLPKILTTFPGVFEANVHRQAAKFLGNRIAEADKNWADLTQVERRVRHDLMAKLAPLEAKLTVNSDVLVELRFETLEYALIAALRQDSLVDRDRTPQTAASIRIVLGTARELGGLDEGQTTGRLRDGEESRLPPTPLDNGDSGRG